MLFCSRCAWYNHALSQVDNQRAPRAIMSNMELTLTSPSFPFTRYVNVHSNISTMLQFHRLQYSCRMHPLITLQLLSSEPYKGSIRSYLLAISCLHRFTGVFSHAAALLIPRSSIQRYCKIIKNRLAGKNTPSTLLSPSDGSRQLSPPLVRIVASIHDSYYEIYWSFPSILLSEPVSWLDVICVGIWSEL
jgi:hypothetical protein